MAFIPNIPKEYNNYVGKWVTTNKKITTGRGTFPKGSRVKIIELRYDGFVVEDAEGNRARAIDSKFFYEESVSDEEHNSRSPETPTTQASDKLSPMAVTGAVLGTVLLPLSIINLVFDLHLTWFIVPASIVTFIIGLCVALKHR